jgi:hypothetical protein
MPGVGTADRAGDGLEADHASQRAYLCYWESGVIWLLLQQTGGKTELLFTVLSSRQSEVTDLQCHIFT